MRRVILTITSTIVGMVLLLSFKTSSGVASTSATVATTTTGTNGSSPTSNSSGTPTTDATPTSTATPTASASRTVTGTAVQTRYGPVQVRITTRGGVITAVQATEYPENDGRDQQINAYAIPVLNAEAKAADSASIDMVSGATYTSTGYIQSLQSALDQLK